jgi:hypothetical protein
VRPHILAACAASLLVSATAVAAQTPGATLRWFEVAVGGGLIGGAGAGSSDANLRANDRTERPYLLFTTDSRFDRTREIHLRASRPLTGRWSIDGGVAISHPDLRADIGADIEGAPATAVTETIDQYFFDAGVIVALHEFRLGRLSPFVTAGAGYLRQLHEGQTVVEHGQLFQAGAGVRYPLLTRASGVVRTLGLRGDVRSYVMRGGVSVENRPRPHIAISGSAFVGF